MTDLINEGNKNGWILVTLILAVLLLSPEQPLSDKKQSSSEWGKIGMGVLLMAGGVVAMIGSAGTATPLAAPIIASGALLAFGGGNLFSGIAGVLTPDPGIPSWVWIGVFIILALVVLRKNKQGGN